MICQLLSLPIILFFEVLILLYKKTSWTNNNIEIISPIWYYTPKGYNTLEGGDLHETDRIGKGKKSS